MNSVQDIANLKFYTDSGHEIYLEKNYIFTWQLISSDESIIIAPSGYFIGEIDYNANSSLSMKTLYTGITNQGKFAVDNNDISEAEQYTLIQNIFKNSENQVKVSINIDNTTYSHTYAVNEIFSLPALSSGFNDWVGYFTSYIGDNINDPNLHEYYIFLYLKKLSLVNDSTGNSKIMSDLTTNLPNAAMFFPFIRYNGILVQEKVSTKFISSNTIVVFEKENDKYVRPSFVEQTSSGTQLSYSLVFSMPSDSQTKILELDNNSYEIKKINEIAFSLNDTSQEGEPFSFAIGTQADEEGIYQNFMGIYLKNNDTNNVFFLGVITIKTEVEGEDERFRTLMGNFGIPDPKYYSNIFEEQDYQEQMQDYVLINKKSKELFLTYSEIFSYVGTYKALFKAIKFLGYEDIIFKEWYTILDSNDEERDIAVQVMDIPNHTFLSQNLANYGISIEDFKRYNKINKLSMIYGISEQGDDEVIDYKIRISDTSVKDSSLYTEVPTTKVIYTYRNTELISKLKSVKLWLEQHVIGVNAYIADITGEGVYFSRVKTQAYTTKHNLKDFYQEQYYSPNLKQTEDFISSSTNIHCTLNEFNDSITFKEYEQVPFETFIKYETEISIPYSGRSSDGITSFSVNSDITTQTVSNTIETPVIGDEYQFKAFNSPNCGTLYEWTDSSQQMIIKDGEIDLMFEDASAALIQSNKPIITLENANIHYSYGQWRKNIFLSIREVTNPETNTVTYELKNPKRYMQINEVVSNNAYFILKSASSNSYIKYDTENKYGIPLLIIKGYQFVNLNNKYYQNFQLDLNKEYVLEILRGDMNFKAVGNCGATLSFFDGWLREGSSTTEQFIQPTYTYISDRLPFVSIDVSTIKSQVVTNFDQYSQQCTQIYDLAKQNVLTDIINKITAVAGEDSIAAKELIIFSTTYTNSYKQFLNTKRDLYIKKLLSELYFTKYEENYKANTFINIPITRIGTYNGIVNVFDKYNNIYMSKANKAISITYNPILIDTFLSQENSNNDKNFYQYNIKGTLTDSSGFLNLVDSSVPIMPRNYRIKEFDYDSINKHLVYDNLSYAFDTPKNNSYLMFENLSELCTRCVDGSTAGTMKIFMLDENPRKIFIENDTSVQLCFYDTKRNYDVSYAGPYKVIDTSFVDPHNDLSYEDDSFIIVDSVDETVKQMIQSHKYETYLLNTTLYEIESSYTNPETGNDIIIFDTYNDKQLFNIEDVVKVRICYNEGIIISDETLINETAYRIVDISTNVQGTNKIGYEINGLMNNINLKESGTLRYYFGYANQRKATFTTKVIGDAYEYTQNIGYDNYTILRDDVHFNSKQMFIEDYLDDTYTGFAYSFDPINLSNCWVNPTTALSTESILFRYEEFPTSIDSGQYAFFKANDKYNVFMPNYHIKWTNYAYILEDDTNIDNYQHNAYKQQIFSCVNDVLTVVPQFLGSNQIQLEAIDIYGNRIINAGEGKLFVNES